MDDEDQSVQDARVEKLWKVLATGKDDRLNIDGLKRGLNKMDHRSSRSNALSSRTDCLQALKNADSLLQDVLKAVDTNGDGHIEYSGTQRFLLRLSGT